MDGFYERKVDLMRDEISMHIERAAICRAALRKIIDMNVQYAIDRYGDALQAESMGCVATAREALAKTEGWTPEHNDKGATIMSQWKPDVCIYHGGCDDGFGAALAVHVRWGNAVEYIPAGYGKPSPDCAGKRVLIVDFSYKQDEMRRLATRAASVVVLDHHKTAEAELYPWSVGGKDGPPANLRGKHTGKSALGRIDELLAMNEMENVEPIVAFFDMHKSGARMAWEFCHAGYDVPRLIEYVEDRDLWRFAIAETKAVSAALRTYPHDFDIWSGFLSDTSRLVTEGGVVLRGHEKNVASMICNRYWRDVGGHRAPVVNVPYHYASDCADAILKTEPDAPFAASYFDRADGKRQWSLRSRDDRMDVSEIAKKFGGGGHRNAAGFEEAA